MKYVRMLPILAISLLAGCATSYTAVIPGVQTYGSMQVTAGENWNAVPASATPMSRKDSRTWTRDGLLLDRLTIYPGINDGESIFASRDKTIALPEFRADMLPNEIEELVESSIVKEFGEGAANVNTSNLRPAAIGERGGFMFDIEVKVTDSPDYRGMVGGFVEEERLFMVSFIAVEPNYYEKHKADAEAVIMSATRTMRTIRNY